MGVHGDSIPVLSKQADDLLKAQITPSWTVEIYFLKVYVICSTLSFLFIFYYDSLLYLIQIGVRLTSLELIGSFS